MMNPARSASTIETRNACSFAVCLTPTRFRTISRTARIAATGRSGCSMKNSRYAERPTRANAALNTNENHTPNPAMVPISGPIALSM